MMYGSGQGLLLLAIFSACVLAVQGQNTTCRIEPIDGTDSGRLICTFSEDIGRAKHNFNVLRYENNNSDVVPETVYACYWPKGGGPPKCDHNPLGFVRIGNITNQVVLEIPDLGKNYEGRYQCQIVPSTEHKPEQCRYTYHEHERTVSSTSDHHQVNAGLVIAVITLAIVIVLGIVFALYLLKTGKCPKSLLSSQYQAAGTNDENAVKPPI